MSPVIEQTDGGQWTCLNAGRRVSAASLTPAAEAIVAELARLPRDPAAGLVVAHVNDTVPDQWCALSRAKLASREIALRNGRWVGAVRVGDQLRRVHPDLVALVAPAVAVALARADGKVVPDPEPRTPAERREAGRTLLSRAFRQGTGEGGEDRAALLVAAAVEILSGREDQ